jgi:hypothetical protein
MGLHTGFDGVVEAGRPNSSFFFYKKYSPKRAEILAMPNEMK